MAGWEGLSNGWYPLSSHHCLPWWGWWRVAIGSCVGRCVVYQRVNVSLVWGGGMKLTKELFSLNIMKSLIYHPSLRNRLYPYALLPMLPSPLSCLEGPRKDCCHTLHPFQETQPIISWPQFRSSLPLTWTKHLIILLLYPVFLLQFILPLSSPDQSPDTPFFNS